MLLVDVEHSLLELALRILEQLLSSPKISEFRMRRDELPVRPGKFLENGANPVGSGDRRPRFAFRRPKQ